MKAFRVQLELEDMKNTEVYIFYSHHGDIHCHHWDILKLCTVTVQLQVTALAQLRDNTQHCRCGREGTRGYFNEVQLLSDNLVLLEESANPDMKGFRGK